MLARPPQANGLSARRLGLEGLAAAAGCLGVGVRDTESGAGKAVLVVDDRSGEIDQRPAFHEERRAVGDKLLVAIFARPRAPWRRTCRSSRRSRRKCAAPCARGCRREWRRSAGQPTRSGRRRAGLGLSATVDMEKTKGGEGAVKERPERLGEGDVFTSVLGQTVRTDWLMLAQGAPSWRDA